MESRQRDRESPAARGQQERTTGECPRVDVVVVVAVGVVLSLPHSPIHRDTTIGTRQALQKGS